MYCSCMHRVLPTLYLTMEVSRITCSAIQPCDQRPGRLLGTTKFNYMLKDLFNNRKHYILHFQPYRVHVWKFRLMVQLAKHQCYSVLASHIHARWGINLLEKLHVNVVHTVLQQHVSCLDHHQNVKVSSLSQLPKDRE